MTQEIRRGVNVYMLCVIVFWTAVYVLNIFMGYEKNSPLLDFRVIALLMLSLIVFVVWHSVVTKGWVRTVAIFSMAALVPFFTEALGVNYGLWFGPRRRSSGCARDSGARPPVSAWPGCR